MMRVLKWLAITVVVLAAIGFLAFLYFIPPFFSVSPEDYVKQTAAPAVSLEKIADPGAARDRRARQVHRDDLPAARAVTRRPARRGRIPNMYLAGGLKIGVKGAGAAITPQSDS